MLRHALVCFALLAAAWALAIDAGADSHEPILIDPTGDAYERSARDLSWEPYAACAYTLELPDEACEPTAPPEGVPDAGTPAPPALDIVAIYMRETQQDLVVELHVARLDAGLSDAMPRDGLGAAWTLCWGETECVAANAHRADGKLDVVPYLLRLDAACGDLGFCIVPAPLAFEPGAPGKLVWTVPRALLVSGDIGATLSDVFANTASIEGDQWIQWSATTPLRSPAGGEGTRYWGTDVASGGRAFTFETASLSAFDAVASAEGADPEGDAPSPDVDVQRVLYLENETTFTLAIEMGRVAPDQPAFLLGGVLTLANGPSFVLAVDNEGGKPEGRLQRCGDPTCTYFLPAPGSFSFAQGSPGWINLTLDRHDLDHPSRGTRLGAVWIGTEIPATTSADPVPAVGAEVQSRTPADWIAIGPPYALRHDSLVTEEDRESHNPAGIVIRDEARDVVATSPEIDTTSGMYDLVLASVEGTSTTSSRVTLGVRDLSRMSVPAGAKAVTYSVAVETAAGTTMVGFYRDASRGEFFCASDTLVLADEKQDPAEAAWTTLEGILSVAREGAGALGGGAAAPSTLTIFVPHSCFGVDEPGEIPASSLTAAVHVIPQTPVAGVPLRAIETVDEARDENLTAFALGTPIARPDVAPWYAEPFGIAGFWDIVGIALAIVLPVGGVLALRSKRNALQRYMDEIDRALTAHPDGSKAREMALVGIRRRLRDDMVRGRIREAHYMIVDARLNEQLKQARMHELTETFGDLPHRVLQKLLEILADGSITRDEARRFGALLEDSGLTTDAKDRIRRKLDLWVVEDAEA